MPYDHNNGAPPLLVAYQRYGKVSRSASLSASSRSVSPGTMWQMAGATRQFVVRHGRPYSPSIAQVECTTAPFLGHDPPGEPQPLVFSPRYRLCPSTELTISSIDAFRSHFVEVQMTRFGKLIPTLSNSHRSILCVDVGHNTAGLVRTEVLPVRRPKSDHPVLACASFIKTSDKTMHPKPHSCSIYCSPSHRSKAFLISVLAASTVDDQDEKATNTHPWYYIHQQS